MSESGFQAPDPEYLDAHLPAYEVEAFIAQGGMGAVYKGRQVSLDRAVAIKVLPREMGEEPGFRESFTSEAKAMARLNHPNLIGVYDFGDIEGMPYLVMEYVHGCSLHESAWNQVVEPAQAIAIVRGICEGLAHAHEAGVVHRDIKPANILLTPKAEPKIGDFGLASAADADTAGLIMGTPGYTAPEVFADPDQVGPLSDVYSVGVILHQLLTGLEPEGFGEPPTQATGDFRLDAIWRRATHVDPAQRYPGAAAMAAELGKWTGGRSIAPAGARPAPFQTSVRPVTPVGSGGGGGLVMALVAVVVLGVVAFLVYQAVSDSGGESPPVVAAAPGVAPQPPAISGDKPDTPPGDDDDPPPSSGPDPADHSAGLDPVPSPGPDPDEDGMAEDPDPALVVVDEPDEERDLPPGDPELRERAIGLIGDARRTRDEKLAENARLFRARFEGRADSSDPAEMQLVELIEEDTRDNRIPGPEVSSSLPLQFGEMCRSAHAKEQGIDATYRADLTRIRDAYVPRLESAAAESEDEDLKQRLLAQADRARDLDAWIELLAPEPARAEKSGFYGFPGKWNVHAYNEVKGWIAHPDGKMTTTEAEWEGRWTMLRDGTLEVKWPDKKPFTFTRDGDGWSGKNPFGGKASLTRGDW